MKLSFASAALVALGLSLLAGVASIAGANPRAASKKMRRRRRLRPQGVLLGREQTPGRSPDQRMPDR